MPPRLLTFDIFGTVLDWRSGLHTACAAAGHPLAPGDFDRIIDAQGALEQSGFQTYTQITRQSLTATLGINNETAAAIAATIGDWPLYPDAPILRTLMQIAPCAAMTNSDRAHGVAIQRRLGFRLSEWLCAEETRLYKPNPGFWHLLGQRMGIEPGPHWWHVSAYADYDLSVAAGLGLTTLFVRRPHARPGPATHSVENLAELLAYCENVIR